MKIINTAAEKQPEQNPKKTLLILATFFLRFFCPRDTWGKGFFWVLVRQQRWQEKPKKNLHNVLFLTKVLLKKFIIFIKSSVLLREFIIFITSSVLLREFMIFMKSSVLLSRFTKTSPYRKTTLLFLFFKDLTPFIFFLMILSKLIIYLSEIGPIWAHKGPMGP